MKGWVGLYGRPGAGYGRVLAPRMLMGLLLGCYVLGDPGGNTSVSDIMMGSDVGFYIIEEPHP